MQLTEIMFLGPKKIIIRISQVSVIYILIVPLLTSLGVYKIKLDRVDVLHVDINSTCPFFVFMYMLSCRCQLIFFTLDIFSFSLCC